MIEIGAPAPAFSLPDQNDQIHSLEQYRGQWLLIYFYPKDDTPGCTKEACSIAEVYDDFGKLGVTVIGVSKDSPQSHKDFASKYQLPFTLLSDEGGEMIVSYGAAGIMGTKRISYLIDQAGKVAKVYPKVDPQNHALELLKDIKQLQDE